MRSTSGYLGPFKGRSEDHESHDGAMTAEEPEGKLGLRSMRFYIIYIYYYYYYISIAGQGSGGPSAGP